MSGILNLDQTCEAELILVELMAACRVKRMTIFEEGERCAAVVLEGYEWDGEGRLVKKETSDQWPVASGGKE